MILSLPLTQDLSGKVVTVDISSWLYQYIKALRDEDGSLVHNAHLLGVCLSVFGGRCVCVGVCVCVCGLGVVVVGRYVSLCV